MDDPICAANGPSDMGTEAEPADTTELIEDVIDEVMKKLDVTDLKTCRCVSKMWNLFATRKLKATTKTIKLIGVGDDIKALRKFLKDTEKRDPSCRLPYGRFKIDISKTTPRSIIHLNTLFQMITQERLEKVTIAATFSPHFCPKVVLDAAQLRRGNMTFSHLECLKLYLRFNEDFHPRHVNMPEILRQSQGLKKINLHLTSYIEPKVQVPIVKSILMTLTSPVNNFQCLNTLGIDYANLTAHNLQILTAWPHPIQNLALGCFDLKLETEIDSPAEAFMALLESRSDTLLNLKIKQTKLFSWEDTILDYSEDSDYDFDRDEQDVHRRQGYDHHDPFRVVNRPRPTRILFPCMRSLQSLEIMNSGATKIQWAWRLSQNSFPRQFPKLKKFGLIRFNYSQGDTPDFMPSLSQPSSTVEEVRLPYAKAWFDPVLSQQMLSLFPALKTLEINYDQNFLEMIFVSVPTLEKLIIHCEDELIRFDAVLTGVPALKEPGDLLRPEKAIDYDMSVGKTKPGISSLTQLKELLLTTEDFYVRITDITAYHVFLKMKNFSRLTVLAHPWEDNTKWLFTESCMEKLKEKVTLTLKVHQRSRREKFFM